MTLRRSILIPACTLAATAPGAVAALWPTIRQATITPTGASVAACAASAAALTLTAARRRHTEQAMEEADLIAARALDATLTGAPALPAGPTVIPGETIPPARATGTCHGHLVRHQTGEVTCHTGRDDCWPGISNYTHTRPPEDCATQSHGCGECLVMGDRR